jgi:hypothetical protein
LIGNTTLSEVIIQVPQKFSQSPHGRTLAPAGIWDHIIVLVSVIVVLISLYLCIRFFLLPKEKDGKHIKHRILNDDIPSGTGDKDER